MEENEKVDKVYFKNNFITESALDFSKEVLFLKKYLKGHKGYIAGGCFKNIFNGEKFKDIDVFFNSQEDFKDALELFNHYVEMGYAKLIYSNENAIAFKMKEDEISIELIKNRYMPALEMIDSFDFSIVKFAFTKEIVKEVDKLGEEYEREVMQVHYHKEFFKHLMLKRTVILKEEIEFPLNTLDRIFRYKGYGYSPCTGTKIKIANAINQMDLPDSEDEMFRGFYAGID